MTTKETGEKIRTMRESRGMTQKDLAIAINMSESAIAMYEAGKRRPKEAVAEAMADVFNVPKWSIYYNEDEMIPVEHRMTFIREKMLAPFTSDDWKHLTNGIANLPEGKKHLPNYHLAATRAMETLIKYRVSYAPVSPLPILKSMPGVIVITFTEIAALANLERGNVLEIIDADSKNAVTVVKEVEGQLKYIVAYNMYASYHALQYALACELGHILMQHDGSKDPDVREAEVECFANYFLFPRPLLKAGVDAGIPPTVGNIGRALGCYAQCIETVKYTPGIAVPKELNMLVRHQFNAYVQNYLELQNVFKLIDSTPLADLGTYMDNYAE